MSGSKSSASSGPATSIGSDARTMVTPASSLDQRVSAGEDLLKQILGFLSWMFPNHPVPTAKVTDTGQLVAGEVDPAIAASVGDPVAHDDKSADSPPDTDPSDKPSSDKPGDKSPSDKPPSDKPPSGKPADKAS